MKILTQFLKKEKMMEKSKMVGFLAALCALFMAVTPPEVAAAQEALASIQLFWLIILTISVTSLFIDFMFFLWDCERNNVGDPDLPYNLTLMIAVGAILVTLVTYMWQYIFSAYPEALGSYIALMDFRQEYF